MHSIESFSATPTNHRLRWFAVLLLCAGSHLLGAGSHLLGGAAIAQDVAATNLLRIELPGTESRPPVQAEGPSRNGRWHGKVTMRVATGAVLGSSDFVNGVEQGDYLDYYPNGTLHHRKRMIGGVAEGVMVKYYPDGTRQCEISMVKDVPTGPAKFYWPNGRKFMDVVQINGRADGEVQLWRPNGQPLAIEVHRRGSMVERRDLSPIDAGIRRELERSDALRNFRAFWDQHLARQTMSTLPQQRSQQEIDERVRGDMAQYESDLSSPR